MSGVVRWCDGAGSTFQCWGVLIMWKIVGHESTTLAVGAAKGCLDIFSPVYQFSLLYPSLWQTARYRLSQRAITPKTTNQPTVLRCLRTKCWVIAAEILFT